MLLMLVNQFWDLVSITYNVAFHHSEHDIIIEDTCVYVVKSLTFQPLSSLLLGCSIYMVGGILRGRFKSLFPLI
jgi:hypothetical protein